MRAEARSLLRHLTSLHVGVEARDGKLRVDAPKGVIDAALRDRIKAHKDALLELLAPPDPIVAVPRDGRAIPLSSQQQRLWYLELLDPGSGVYNLPAAYRLRGPLDPKQLEGAYRKLVARHESLRTIFTAEAPPSQRLVSVDAATHWTFETIAAEALPGALAARAQHRFDLAQAPLMRATLFRLADDEHVLLLSAHHIISDGTSLDVLIDELDRLYRGETLPPAGIQYADYAHHQAAAEADLAEEEALDHYAAVLDGAPALDFPTDRPRPAFRRGTGANCIVDLDVAVRLDRFAREQGASPFMVLLAAWTATLSRYVHRTDISVGTAVAGRHRPELERVTGLFANTLVLRMQWGAEDSFAKLVARSREMSLDAFEHATAPFEKLVQRLQPARDTSTTPLFQTFVALLEQRSPRRVGEARVGPERISADVALTDLALWLDLEGDRLRCELNYSTELFEKSTAERLLRHFVALLEAGMAEPDRPVVDLPMLSDDDQRLLDGLSETALSLPERAGVHENILARAAACPQQTAVVGNRGALTYEALSRRASSVAASLVAAGVKPNDLVGVSLDRHADMLAALLGIWMAGAAYVPLDPKFPADRLRYMVEQSAIEVLVSERALVASLPFDRDAQHLVLLEDVEEGQAPSLPPCPPERTAYVIFTSGSTGKPKGVVLSHGAVSNFLRAMTERPGLTADDRLLGVTTLSFDIAVLELYLPLWVGGTAVVASADEAADGLALLDLMRRERATVMQATPATWRLLLAAGWQAGQLPLKKVLCGGEAMPSDLAVALTERVDEVWNMYGPTETTVWSTCYRLPDSGAPILIGSAVGNTVVEVLDSRMRRVPQGALGELYLGGAGVADGYLGRPDLTEERFVIDPHHERRSPVSRWNEQPPKLYRTGDRVRVRGDGQLDYISRIDQQVKVRGYRIELGEIEAVLSQHAAVESCAAVVREVRAGDNRIFAYVTINADVSVEALRLQAKTSLPDYMVPSTIEVLDGLPLTPNGKVDKKTLLARPLSTQSRNDRVVGPRTEPERTLVGHVARLIGVEENTVSVHDNFFELGGHSLLAMELIAAIREETGIALGAKDILLESFDLIARKLPGDHAQSSFPGRAESEPTVETFFFGDGLYGIYRAPPTELRGGVLICAPLMQEYMRTHWALRRLAHMLCREGFAVLRFDYRGCGDAAGELSDGGVEKWVDDVHTAADELRRRSGQNDVSAVGLRLGASLAALAADRPDRFSQLVLWDPIVDGADNLERLRRVHETSMSDPMRYSLLTRAKRDLLARLGRAPALAEGELIGFALPGGLANELAAIDLRRNPPRAPRLFIARSHEIPGLRAMEDAVTTIGHEVRSVSLDEAGEWYDASRVEDALVPQVIPGAIVRHLSGGDP